MKEAIYHHGWIKFAWIPIEFDAQCKKLVDCWRLSPHGYLCHCEKRKITILGDVKFNFKKVVSYVLSVGVSVENFPLVSQDTGKRGVSSTHMHGSSFFCNCLILLQIEHFTCIAAIRVSAHSCYYFSCQLE